MTRIIKAVKVGTKEQFEKINSSNFIKINNCDFYINRTEDEDMLYLVVDDSTGANFVKTNTLY